MMKTAATIVLTIFFLFATIHPLHAQWIPSNEPAVSGVNCFVVSGESLFAGTSSGGVYRSTNNGSSWNSINSGLSGIDVLSLVCAGTTLFAGTAGVYGIHGIVGGGVFRSNDGGTNWTPAGTGLSNNTVLSLAVSGTTLFAGTFGNGVFLSANNGASWAPAGLAGNTVRCFAVNGGNMFAGTSAGVFLSTDNGASWKEMNAGLPTNPANRAVYSLAVAGASLFAGTFNGGVFISTNDGANWVEANTGLTNKYALSLAVIDANIFVGTWGGGVFVSGDGGKHWREVNSGLLNASVYSLFAAGEKLFAGTEGAIFYNNRSAVPVGVESSVSHPHALALEGNYPNPFNHSTNIVFSLAERSFVSLKIFDASGKEVTEMISEELDAGRHAKQWDAAGVSSGVYFYRLQTEAFADTKQLVLLK